MCVVCPSRGGASSCPLGAGVPALWGSGPAGGRSGPLVVCSVLLSALLLCAWCVVLEICLYSHFKAVFRGFCGVCVGLCCLGALRGLCGFCVRVELGGLEASGVFAPVFPLFASILSVFHLLSLSSGALPLLSFACPVCLFCLFLCLCCFFFPYGLYAKKKGRKGLSLASSLRVLWVLC